MALPGVRVGAIFGPTVLLAEATVLKLEARTKL
jgi:hypothetical protein